MALKVMEERRRWLVEAGAAALALLSGGCVVTERVRSADPAALQQARAARAATLSWSSVGLLDGGPEVVLGVVGAAIASATSQESAYTMVLNAKCVHAIEEVLRTEGTFQYLAREEARPAADVPQFFSQNQLGSAVDLRAVFNVRPGWKKRFALELRWTLVAPTQQAIAVVDTMSDSAEMDVLPDKADPKYEGLWIELARRGAREFLAMVGARRF